jgi:hypothetical protein
VGKATEPQKMPQSDAWRLAYRETRYLENKSADFINDRFKYLMANMLKLTDSGKLAFPDVKGPGGQIWEAWTHIHEEYALRGTGLPAAGDIGLAPSVKPTYPNTPKGLANYQARTRRETGQIFRFSQRRHLQSALDGGLVRLNAASSYSDPSLNLAMRDEELSFVYHVMPKDVKIRTQDGQLLPFQFREAEVKFGVPGDFHALCLSWKFNLRLFDDFGADTCLVIYDAIRFIDAIKAAVKALNPEALVGAKGVTYIDPCRPGPDRPPLPFAKHFKFFYQDEFRVVVVYPGSTATSLPPLDVQIGPMKDYAELISA